MRTLAVLLSPLCYLRWPISNLLRLRPKAPLILVFHHHRIVPPLYSKYIEASEIFYSRNFLTNEDEEMADARYCIEYAKTGRSGCKKCKQQIAKGVGRIGKIAPNPFSDDGGEMKVWYHMRCIFETFKRARASTKKIETPADLEGFLDLKDEEKEEIKSLIKEFITSKSPAKPKQKKGKASSSGSDTLSTISSGESSSKVTSTLSEDSTLDESYSTESTLEPDNSFSQFCKLCSSLEKEPSYNAKTSLITTYIKHGTSGDGFKGNIYLLVKLLLPTAGKKRVYNLQSKQIVKVLSKIFGCSVDEMMEDLEKGDVAETSKTFFKNSKLSPPATASTLTLTQVDSFLDRMVLHTREEEQRLEFTRIIKRCTAEDLKMIIRLIVHDLRINAGPKHVLNALDPNAYAAFQASNDLKDVVDRVVGGVGDDGGVAKPGMKRNLSIRTNIMTPVKPMLAEACRSVAMAMRKCPNGMYAEIKYDGERVQVHKEGDKFEYFSRSLKTVQSHKVENIKDYLPKACPHGHSMILDCEVLMMDMKTSKPLPFGTLGIHKKSAFKDACCCLFIFDIIYFNGETLMDKPMYERRRLLEENVTEVKNRIMLSEQTLIKREDDSVLSDLIMKVIKQGLEGLVLKDMKSIYEPGKRHWLKVKKDYLEGGAMADSADLIVLGAYIGTGNKGGMMSVFLMGVYDKSCDRFRTVAKCGNGHDDATLNRLQTELEVVKISKDMAKVPPWLLVNKALIPDFVVKDPKDAPIWEITGAEFTSSNLHTAGGISIRFPRVTRIRDDKDWTDATDLERLKTLFKTSKENVDIPGLKTGVTGEKDGGNAEEEDGKEMDTGGPSNAADVGGEVLTTSSQTSNRKRKLNTRTLTKTLDHTDDTKTSPSKRRRLEGKAVPKSDTKHKKDSLESLDDTEVKCAGVTIKKPLLNLFSGVKIYLLPETSNAAKLRRYFISYDGEVMDEFQKSQATYYITDDGHSSSESGVRYVKANWIWDSLKQKQQLPIEDYLV